MGMQSNNEEEAGQEPIGELSASIREGSAGRAPLHAALKVKRQEVRVVA